MPKANPMKGEALLGQRLLRVNIDSWMAFEEQEAKTLPEFIQEMTMGLGVRQVAKWLKAFLVDDLSDDEVKALMEAEGYTESSAALGKAIDSFFAPKKGGSENPPKAE